MERDCVAVRLLASVTLKVTEVGPPAAVGVPEITPLELSDSPAGSEPGSDRPIIGRGTTGGGERLGIGCTHRSVR